MLRTPLHRRLEARLLELALEEQDDVGDELRPILLRLRYLLLDLRGLARIQVFEGEVLELDLDPLDAEPVGERRVDVERLLRDALLRLGLHVLERPHVVGPVGELDEDHPDVLRHRDQHLAEVLGLLLLLGRTGPVREGTELRHPLDQGEHFVAEQVADLGRRGEGVFDGVVEQTRDDARLVELQLGEEAGDLEGMDEVRLARLAHLALMDLGAVDIRLLDEVEVCVGTILPDALEDVVQPDHRAA